MPEHTQLPPVAVVAEKLTATLTAELTAALKGFEMEHKRGRKVLLEATALVVATFFKEAGISESSVSKYMRRGQQGAFPLPVFEEEKEDAGTELGSTIAVNEDAEDNSGESSDDSDEWDSDVN